MTVIANYLWAVTASEVLQAAGHPTPTSPTLPTTTATSAYIDRAAARVNGEVRALTGGDPETLAGEDLVTYQLGRGILIKIAAAEWLQNNGGDPARASDLLDQAVGPNRDGRGGEMSTLRRLMAQARTALVPVIGPAPTDGRTEAPPSWLDGGRGEEFG